MGRRALRKIDPKLDLTAHLKTFDELPRPLAGTALFGRTAPREVEVGSGMGIKVARRYARFAAPGLAKAGLGNALVVCGDALRVFRELLPDECLAAVHVYFPDPWWKKRHKKRRVMRETFLADVQRTLARGGTLHFWTDVEEYYHTGLALVAAHTHLEGPFGVAEVPAQHDLDYRTHFERRMRRHAQPVYRAWFRKPTQ